VHRDESREIKGKITGLDTGSNALAYIGAANSVDGVFSSKPLTNTNRLVQTTGSSYLGGYIELNTSFVVPVGNENSPRTLSVNYWRRVS